MYPYYAKLDNQYSSGYGTPPPPPPPYNHPNVPRYPTDYRHKRPSAAAVCLRCICCCYCLLILLVVSIVVLFASVYRIYDPKTPEYMVDNIQVKVFDMQRESLNAEFQLNLTIDNQNKKLGFNYGSDNYIQILYSNISLGTGQLPAFHQEHDNTTVMPLLLKGRTAFGPDAQKGLMENRRVHAIPVNVNAKVPVSIVIGQVVLQEFKIYVYCNLTLDNLSPNNKSEILAKNTSFKYEL